MLELLNYVDTLIAVCTFDAFSIHVQASAHILAPSVNFPVTGTPVSPVVILRPARYSNDKLNAALLHISSESICCRMMYEHLALT